AFYRDLKQRVVEAGREPDALKIMPGVSVIVAPTLAEAQAREAQLQALVHPEAGLALLERMLGNVDLRGVDLDAPLPAL
ncbi:hypothetical protein, partial [Clostridium perfringens]